MTLIDLIILSCFGCVAYGVFLHGKASHIAYKAAKRKTENTGVLLLDQSVTLAAMTLRKSSSSLFAIARRYQFEFSTVGDKRYKGHVVLYGSRPVHVELEAFKPAENHPSL